MNWDKELFREDEKPLDRFVGEYSNTSIFRSIAFIGDSLSSGEFETHDKDGNPKYYDFFDYSWGQYIARKNGLKAYNFSRGGMTAKEYIESFAGEKGFWDKDKACQAYVIALGANDIKDENVRIGSIADIDKTDYTKNNPTFAGYYAQIISKYKEISPDAKFFFVTFPNDEKRDKDKSRKVYELLYDISKYFDNSYVIDLYKYGPTYNSKFKEKFYLHGHMNPSGYIFTAKIIDSYIDYIVRHNPNDFKNVGFICSNID